MKLQVFVKIIVIWLVLMLIELSKSFPWTIIMQILMAQLQNLITGKKNCVFDRLFCWCQKMRTKLWLCQFFKFSTMEQVWALKLIAWVDIRVVSIFYSFQSVQVDLGGELEKLTKYSKITEYSKSMSPNFDSPYLWENSSPPLCVIHIQKRLDLLFHPVFPEFVLCCKNHTQIAL